MKLIKVQDNLDIYLISAFLLLVVCQLSGLCSLPRSTQPFSYLLVFLLGGLFKTSHYLSSPI